MSSVGCVIKTAEEGTARDFLNEPVRDYPRPLSAARADPSAEEGTARGICPRLVSFARAKLSRQPKLAAAVTVQQSLWTAVTAQPVCMSSVDMMMCHAYLDPLQHKPNLSKGRHSVCAALPSHSADSFDVAHDGEQERQHSDSFMSTIRHVSTPWRYHRTVLGRMLGRLFTGWIGSDAMPSDASSGTNTSRVPCTAGCTCSHTEPTPVILDS